MNESFEVERAWTTQAGLQAACLIVRGSHRCGYVRVPAAHSLHEVEYSQETEALAKFDPTQEEVGKRGVLTLLTAGCNATDGECRRSPDVVFDVHGGITFSGHAYWNKADDGWWFGFDCMHLGDGSMDPMMSILDDPVRSEQYVVDECESLAKQITGFAGGC